MKNSLFFVLFVLGFHVVLFGEICVPYDCVYPCETLKNLTLPSDLPVPTPWVAAATVIPGQPNDGYVEVDWMQLLDLDNNNQVVNDNQFEVSGPLSPDLGGLYSRWFVTDEHTPLSAATAEDGLLHINVGIVPNNVCHWWLPRIYGIPGHHYALKMRVKIHGNIGVQLGCDYWNNLTSVDFNYHEEAWLSDWYGDTSDQFIEITSPLSELEQVRFDRSKYGFYSNGEFFIAKEIIEYIGGTDVYLGGNTTPMTLDGEMYRIQTNQYLSAPQTYCFKVTNPYTSSPHQPRWIPHAIIEHLLYPSDAIDNGMGGYNFHTSASIPVGVEDIINSNAQYGCDVYWDSDHKCKVKLTDWSNGTVLIQFFDIRGRKIHSIQQDIQSKNAEITWSVPKLPPQILLIRVSGEGRKTMVRKLTIMP